MIPLLQLISNMSNADANLRNLVNGLPTVQSVIGAGQTRGDQLRAIDAAISTLLAIETAVMAELATQVQDPMATAPPATPAPDPAAL